MFTSQSKAAWKFWSDQCAKSTCIRHLDLLTSIKSIWMSSKTLCTLIGVKGALVVQVCGLVCARVLQCLRRNATSWRLMLKNCWFNAVKVFFYQNGLSLSDAPEQWDQIHHLHRQLGFRKVRICLLDGKESRHQPEMFSLHCFWVSPPSHLLVYTSIG